MIHSREKRHTCEFCGKQYSRSGRLKIHIRSHTNEKPYECYICNKKYAEGCNLNTHMKAKHAKNNQNLGELSNPDDTITEKTLTQIPKRLSKDKK